MIVTGAKGIVGSRLMRVFPSAVELDRVSGHDLTDATASFWDLFRGQDAVLHLAAITETRDGDTHLDSLAAAMNVISACIRHRVPRVVFASSTWAEPRDDRPMTAYGHGKRAVEEVLKMFALDPERAAVAVRIGCVVREGFPLELLDPLCRSLYQSDTELADVFRRALAAPPGFTLIEKIANSGS
jgi:nucleoside-diphosphate-sugar epimerase